MYLYIYIDGECAGHVKCHHARPAGARDKRRGFQPEPIRTEPVRKFFKKTVFHIFFEFSQSKSLGASMKIFSVASPGSLVQALNSKKKVGLSRLNSKLTKSEFLGKIWFCKNNRVEPAQPDFSKKIGLSRLNPNFKKNKRSET